MPAPKWSMSTMVFVIFSFVVFAIVMYFLLTSFGAFGFWQTTFVS